MLVAQPPVEEVNYNGMASYIMKQNKQMAYNLGAGWG